MRPTLYYNATIHCMDDENTVARAILVKEGCISEVYSGANQPASGAAGLDYIDLEGRHVVPGFIDAHCHFSIGAFGPLWTDVSDGNVSRLGRVAAGSGWIRARQPPHWYAAPSLGEFDSIVADAPAIIVEQGYHRCALNSQARKWLSQRATAVDFDRLLTLPETLGAGTLTDLPDSESRPDAGSSAVFETAMGWAENASRDYYQERYAQVLPDLVENRARQFIAQGVTTVCDAAVTPNLEELLRRSAYLSKLPISVVMMPVGSGGLFQPPLDRLTGELTGSGTPELRVGPLKLFADGGRQCLIKDFEGRVRGHGYYDSNSLSTLMARASNSGFALACHAMGNLGLEVTLRAYREAATRNAPRAPIRIEHATLVDDTLLQQMSYEGAIVIVQPNWIRWLGMRWLDAPHRHLKFLAFRDMIDHGLIVAGSSDSTDGSLASPLEGMACAVSRLVDDRRYLDEHQALKPSEALALYTRNAAKACGTWNDRGSIEASKRADFVVVSGDILDSNALVSQSIHVRGTYIAGELVHTF